jgi:hypothetical protein
MATSPLVLLTALAFVAYLQSRDEPLYPSSVVGTDFDFIRDEDPDVFESLEPKGKAEPEMPDKTDDDAPLRKPAWTFVARFLDGTSIHIAVDVRVGKEEQARAEALRYTPRLGKLPTSLRRGVQRVVIHKEGKGDADASAFSDVGLIVLYANNATKRISTHDLEETVFHESVHAAWDETHERSQAWLAAQKRDGRFVTNYAKKNADEEDLAESALFAYTLVHHPGRIPEKEAAKIRRAIPARIAFVETLLPKEKPIHFKVCLVDLTRTGQLSDILSNALTLGLKKDEADVRSFLESARRESDDAEQLMQAAARHFETDAAALKRSVEEYRHCNCRHGDLSEPVVPKASNGH